jgi:hypothetical protein
MASTCTRCETSAPLSVASRVLIVVRGQVESSSRHVTFSRFPQSLLHLLVSIVYTSKYDYHSAHPPTMAGESSSRAPKQRSDLLRFTSHRHLRQRLLLSILSGKSLRIDAIRSDDVQVGLRDYEINLLRLIEKVTNGSTVEISTTGM